MAATSPAAAGNDLYDLFRAYRDVLIRIGDQAGNFDHSEAMDVLSRIADSDHVTDHQRLESEQEIDVTTEFLNGSGEND